MNKFDVVQSMVRRIKGGANRQELLALFGPYIGHKYRYLIDVAFDCARFS